MTSSKIAALVATVLLGGIVAVVAGFAVFGETEHDDPPAPEPTLVIDDSPMPTESPSQLEPTESEPSTSEPSATESSEPPSPTRSDLSSDAEAARAAAQTWIDAVNDRDTALAETVACPGITPNMESLPVDYPPFRLVGDPTLDGVDATVTAETISGKPTYTFLMPLRKDPGIGWCIAG